MNSLFSLTSAPSPASALASRDAAVLDPAGAPFSAFLTLAAFGSEAGTQPSPTKEPATLTAQGYLLPVPGTALPLVTGTGNFLPSALPDSPAQPEAEGNSGENTLDPAAMALFAPTILSPCLPQLAALIPIGGEGNFEAPVPAGAAAFVQQSLPRLGGGVPLVRDQASPLTATGTATGTATATVASAAAAAAAAKTSAPETGTGTSTSAGESAPSVRKEPAVAVVMDAAPAETRAPAPSAEGESRSARIAAQAPSAAAPAEQQADQQPGQSPAGDSGAAPSERSAPSTASAHPMQATNFTSAQAALPGAPLAAPAAPVQPAAVQDLTAIVDRLVAAREVFAAATAALALHHAEFGEMTLRFEQQQDGQLTVGLAAANAEAHRAVAAALAAERNPASGERPNPDSSQQNGQARTGTGTGNGGGASSGGLDRNNSGGTDRNQPGNGHARHDSPRANPARQGWRPSSRGEGTKGGIYA